MLGLGEVLDLCTWFDLSRLILISLMFLCLRNICEAKQWSSDPKCHGLQMGKEAGFVISSPQPTSMRHISRV